MGVVVVVGRAVVVVVGRAVVDVVVDDRGTVDLFGGAAFGLLGVPAEHPAAPRAIAKAADSAATADLRTWHPPLAASLRFDRV